MFLGQLRMGARQAKNAALSTPPPSPNFRPLEYIPMMTEDRKMLSERLLYYAICNMREIRISLMKAIYAVVQYCNNNIWC